MIKQWFKQILSKHSTINILHEDRDEREKERKAIYKMFTLRAEHDEYYNNEHVIEKGRTYSASFTRGFIHPNELDQFIRFPDLTKDIGKLVIFIDIVCDDGKLVTTFCYNTCEFNENWTIVK